GGSSPWGPRPGRGCRDGGSVLAPGSQLAPAFPSASEEGRTVAVGGVRSPVTVAGPRRIRTGFLPFAIAWEKRTAPRPGTGTSHSDHDVTDRYDWNDLDQRPKGHERHHEAGPLGVPGSVRVAVPG